MQKFISASRSVDLSAYRRGATPADLTLFEAGELFVSYAPFDHIACQAELVLVGLTPGRTQAANALEALQAQLKAGRDLDGALAAAKSTASFSGSMRSSLIAMLDQVGVPQKFGRTSAAAFFEAGSPLVHFTSMLRYPVYLAGGANYSGAPAPLSYPILRKMVDTHLAEEARALPRAIWVPLGGHAEAGLKHLSDAGLLDPTRVLAGLPHPSGANAERIAYFLGRKPRASLSVKTNPDRIDAARDRLQRQVAGLKV
jgi:hypothetical protein